MPQSCAENECRRRNVDLMVAQSQKHIRALDGVRGIAILAVMAFHYSSALSGGTWIEHKLTSLFSHGLRGVDLFFVLSGYLITGILVNSRGSENYFKVFYARRVLRIFPVYFLYMFVVFGILRTIHPEQFLNTRIWTYFAFVSNLQPGTGLKDPYLPHIWSLAVEEQFYFVWPTFVLLCPPRYLFRACTAVVIAALVLRVVVSAEWAPQAITILRMTPFRVDALAAGAMMTEIVRDKKKSAFMKRYGLWMALASFVVFLAIRHTSAHDTLGFSAIVVICAELVFWAASSNPAVLCKPWLTSIGKYSYGMYVYHILLGLLTWSWLRHLQGPLPPVAVELFYIPFAICTVYAVGWVSFRYFESPFLRLKDRFEPTPVLPGTPQESVPGVVQA